MSVTERMIHVRLAPAATPAERAALRELLVALNARKLTLPGDTRGLPLTFDLQMP